MSVVSCRPQSPSFTTPAARAASLTDAGIVCRNSEGQNWKGPRDHLTLNFTFEGTETRAGMGPAQGHVASAETPASRPALESLYPVASSSPQESHVWWWGVE